MKVLERLPKESARAYATRVLEANIVECELVPGSLVSESAIAKELGLSRAPVKEAVGELEHVRLVEVRPQAGILVSKVDVGLLRDTILARRAIETAVYERYCRSDEQADLNELKLNLEMQQVLFRYGEYRKLWEADNAFHRMALTLTGGENLWFFLEGMRLINDRARFLSEHHSQTERTLTAHRRIYEALAAKDAEGVREAVASHLRLEHVMGDHGELRDKYPEYFTGA